MPTSNQVLGSYSEPNVNLVYVCLVKSINPGNHTINPTVGCDSGHSRTSRDVDNVQVEVGTSKEDEPAIEVQRSAAVHELVKLGTFEYSPEKIDEVPSETMPLPFHDKDENSEDEQNCANPRILSLTKTKWLSDSRDGSPDARISLMQSTSESSLSEYLPENSPADKALSTVLALDKEHNLFGLSNTYIQVVDRTNWKKSKDSGSKAVFHHTAIVQACFKTCCKRRSNTGLPSSLKCGGCRSRCLCSRCQSCTSCLSLCRPSCSTCDVPCSTRCSLPCAPYIYSKLCPAKPCPARPCPSKPRPSCSKLCPAKLCPAKPCPAKPCPSKPCPSCSKLCPAKPWPARPCPSKPCPSCSKLCPAKPWPARPSPSKPCPSCSKLCPAKPCPARPCPSKPCPSCFGCCNECPRFGLQVSVIRKPKYDPVYTEIEPRSSCILSKPLIARSCHHYPCCIPPSPFFPYLMPCFWPARAGAPCSEPTRCFHNPPCPRGRTPRSKVHPEELCPHGVPCVGKDKSSKCENYSCIGRDNEALAKALAEYNRVKDQKPVKEENK